MKKINKLYILGLILSLITVGLTSYQVGKYNTNKANEKQETVSEELVEVDEKTYENFSPQGAIDAAQGVIIELHKDEKDRTMRERIDLLFNKTPVKEVVSEEALKRFHNTPSKETAEGFEELSLVSVMITVSTLEELGNSDGRIVLDNAPASVYFDNEMRLAIVPYEVFTGSQSGLSITMGYLNGEWYVIPYPNIESMLLVTTLEGNK